VRLVSFALDRKISLKRDLRFADRVDRALFINNHSRSLILGVKVVHSEYHVASVVEGWF